jgi:NADH:ubiquinone oxidoreductase subunit E
MAEKIKVIICAGTACYVMGTSDILLLGDHLPRAVLDHVDIDGAPCLGMCRDGAKGKAPFVSINGEIMERATLSLVIKRVMEIHDAQYQ